MRVINYVLKFTVVTVIIVLTTWIIKGAFFSIYIVPSFSMHPTLQPGNYILVSKCSYNFQTPKYFPLSKIPFPFFRKKGVVEVKHNDLVVFNSPIPSYRLHSSQKIAYVKRAIGLPGDTLLIKQNGFEVKNFEPNKLTGKKNSKEEVSYMPIPSKGDWIVLSDSTKKSWRLIVERDGNDINGDENNNILINGEKVSKYKVKQDYYFMRGDNLNLSDDSRNWGLVPRQDLIGRVELVL